VAGPDLSSLTSAVDFSTVVTAVISVGVAAVGCILVRVGVSMVLRAVRGEDDPYDGTGPSGLDFRDLR
jgi:hypothetical protein